MSGYLTSDEISLDDVFVEIDEDLTVKEKKYLVSDLRKFIRDYKIKVKKIDFFSFSVKELIKFYHKLVKRYNDYEKVVPPEVDDYITDDDLMDIDNMAGYKTCDLDFGKAKDKYHVKFLSRVKESQGDKTYLLDKFGNWDVSTDDDILIGDLREKVQLVLNSKISPSFTDDEYEKLTDEETDKLNEKFGTKEDPYPFGFCSLINLDYRDRDAGRKIFKRVTTAVEFVDTFLKTDLSLKSPSFDVWYYRTGEGTGHYTDRYTRRGKFLNVKHACAASILAHSYTTSMDFKNQEDCSKFYRTMLNLLLHRSNIRCLTIENPNKIESKLKSKIKVKQNGNWELDEFRKTELLIDYESFLKDKLIGLGFSNVSLVNGVLECSSLCGRLVLERFSFMGKSFVINKISLSKSKKSNKLVYLFDYYGNYEPISWLNFIQK